MPSDFLGEEKQHGSCGPCDDSRRDQAKTAPVHVRPRMEESMMSFESLLYGGTFTLLPVVLLASRFFWRRPPWWVIILLIIILGWATYFLGVVTHAEDLYELVESTENPSQELLEEAYLDSGPLVFAAFMGWVVALAYAVPWYILFLMATWIRSVIRRQRRGER